MDRLITKYKISISVISMILLLLWVWTMASVVTGKEEHINQQLDMLNHMASDHNRKIESQHHRINNVEDLNKDVKADVRLIQKDIKFIREGIEKLWDRYDDKENRNKSNPYGE